MKRAKAARDYCYSISLYSQELTAVPIKRDGYRDLKKGSK